MPHCVGPHVLQLADRHPHAARTRSLNHDNVIVDTRRDTPGVQQRSVQVLPRHALIDVGLRWFALQGKAFDPLRVAA